MHEASIASSILEISIGTAVENNSNKITLVSVRIGKMATIDESSLRFAFDAIKENTIAENAVFEFNRVPLLGVCTDCKHEAEYPGYFVACAECGSMNIKMISGDELEIAHIEVE